MRNRMERKDKRSMAIKMDGFGFIEDEKHKEKKKLMKAGSILAWAALILMWAVLAARSTVMIG